MSQGIINVTPYFIKCKKCGKMHLYELWEDLIEDIECPTCGAKIDMHNIVLKGKEFNAFEKY